MSLTSSELETLEASVAAGEARHRDIRLGLAKEILWADPRDKSVTEFSIVYIHGFSASKFEVRPLPDLIARHLGANLFFTRLSGHGRTGDAMAEGTVEAWRADMVEALAIGRTLGHQTLIIATSTGATLAIWALSHPDLAKNVLGAIFLSPNFRLKSRAACILALPVARLFLPAIIGNSVPSSRSTRSTRPIGRSPILSLPWC